MLWLIRAGAYLVSGLTIWQFAHGGAGIGSILAAHKPLTLDPDHSMIFGVCAGLSNFTGMDVTLIRLIWVILAFYRGIGIGLYLLAFLIMPVKG
ncbi:Hypothetical protein LUCI_0479 [Lucifera butyrica]|uniref:Phage shock protein PspC N-terminal domain-containing protein n=1 Tax=Lucifera butyrica TaxID=1351585 RepID=A0A498R4S8_9FIRM|nr:PspC domain-containing protein [Lucifera butyrica]VBB05272.1 Hypothetical protein LUCI_0479 [Lucifera butyrica]